MSYFNLDWIGFDPKVILDVGSYNGADAKRLKDKFPNARVIAIEASSKNFKNLLNPELSGIEVFHNAIGKADGDIEFHDTFGRLTGSGSILEPSKYLFNFADKTGDVIVKKEIVEGKRLDTFCKENNITQIDFIHMDLQGAEFEALIGLGEMRPKMMFLEMGGGSLNCYEGSTDPTKKLIEMGYELVKKLPGDQLWRLKCQ